jgi:N-methylhydantoinase A
LEEVVPMALIKGVTERVDSLGNIMIPMYEKEIKPAVDELIKEGVEAIIIIYLYSYMNPAHELRTKELVEEIVKNAGKEKDIDVFCSYEIAPSSRECNRFNALAIEAYAGKIARNSMKVSENRIYQLGGTKPLQVTLAHGGLSQIKQAKMIETAMSGPVGGILGSSYIGGAYGMENIISTDVGGTSFDIGLITNGRIHLNLEPIVARFLINIPSADVKSIGAGGGTIAFVDSMTGRLKVGPKSAGAMPGPACYGKGGENPTVTDADMVLGYLNPKYFLGGDVDIDKNLAVKAIKEKICNPLGVSIEQAAWGIKTIIDAQMENYCRSMISSRGYAVEDYVLLGFGGAVPSHVAGYTQNTRYKDILMFPYSSVFCAFGAATADFSHQYVRSTLAYVPFKASEDVKMAEGKKITTIWNELKSQAYEQLNAEGFAQKDVVFDHIVFGRYRGQLDEIEIHSPVSTIRTPHDMDVLIDAFEDEYTSIFTAAAKYPEAGYLFMNVGLVASVKKPKPQLIPYELADAKPPSSARKEVRDCFFEDGWLKTEIYELSELKAGNVINGPAVIEHVNTNYVIPPDRRVELDKYKTLWLKKGGK